MGHVGCFRDFRSVQLDWRVLEVSCMGVLLEAGRHVLGVLAPVLQGIVWPAFLVYEVFSALAG